MLRIVHRVGWLGCMAALIACGDGDATSSGAGGGAHPALPSTPAIILKNFTMSSWRDGRMQHRVRATWGRMNERERKLDLSDVKMTFFDDGRQRGKGRCGWAQVWMTARPNESIGERDMLFEQGVDLETEEGWRLRTPHMRYRDAEEQLTSDAGYVKQMKMGDDWLIGRGNRFEIQLRIEDNTFDTWAEHGAPAVLEKASKPVIQ